MKKVDAGYVYILTNACMEPYFHGKIVKIVARLFDRYAGLTGQDKTAPTSFVSFAMIPY